MKCRTHARAWSSQSLLSARRLYVHLITWQAIPRNNPAPLKLVMIIYAAPSPAWASVTHLFRQPSYGEGTATSARCLIFVYIHTATVLFGLAG